MWICEQPLLQIVRFDQSDAGGGAFHADDRGVVPGIEERGDDGRFGVLGRSEIRGEHGLIAQAEGIEGGLVEGGGGRQALGGLIGGESGLGRRAEKAVDFATVIALFL
jgi:hypothetical protein